MRVDGKEVRGEGVYAVDGKEVRGEGVYACGWEGVYAREAGSLLCTAELNTTWQRSHTEEKSILIVLM